MYGLTTHDSGARRQYAIRTTPSGDAVWEYIAGEAREELVLDAIEGPDGDLILCVGIDEDAGLVQLGPDGEVRWAKRYALPGWQFASCVAPAGEGEYLLAGFSMRERPRRQADTWLARTAANGDLLWETSFGADASDDYAQSLLPLGDGTYLIGGLGGGMPISVVDGAGNVRWSRRLAGPSVHGAEAMIELGGGGVLVAGFVQILNGRSYDAILVRTELDGGEE